ncbi:MAG: PLP-dependent aminotransferase family protein [Rhizobiaceae bacterium]
MLYVDHVEKLIEDIISGEIKSGERLPTYRDYAYDKGISAGTAARIYSELAKRGYATGEVGRGTYARLPDHSPRDVGAGGGLQAGAVRTDLIDLTLNFPILYEQTEKLREGLRKLSNDSDISRYLEYQSHSGAQGDRELIAEYAIKTGFGSVDPAGIVLTQGGQHGIALCILALCKPGDRIACEDLTYPGFKAAAQTLGIDLVPIGCDEDGLKPSELDNACAKHHITSLYCMPTVQNPYGYVMSEERRHELLRVVVARKLSVIEDAAYSFLEETPPPSLVSLAPDHVIYIDTFSKVIAPGFRVGYVATCNARWAAAIANGVRITTWSATPLSLGIITDWLKDNTVDRWRDEKRRQAVRLQKVLRATLPNDIRIDAHHSSYHALIHLPTPWRSDDFAISLAKDGVAISPVRAFAVSSTYGPAPPEVVRVAFGGISEALLQEAMKIFRVRLLDPVASTGAEL